MGFVRVSLGVLGGVTVAVAAVLVAVSVGLFTFIGGAETISLPDVRVMPVDGRLTAEDISSLFDDGRFVTDPGTVSLTIRNADGTPVFAGITDRLTAERFVDGDPRRLGLWLATAEGNEADLTWDFSGDDWVFVVADADGSAAGEVFISGTLAASPFRLAAGTVAALGVATGIAGGLLLLSSARLGRRQPPSTTTPSPVAVGAGV